MANVGKNIRLLRKQRQMTQDDLAERLYVSRQTVSNYETGKSNPDIDMLVRIAEVLQTDVKILIFGLPVSPSRKKEVRKLLLGAVLLAVLAFLFFWLTPLEMTWRKNRFDLGPAFAMQMLLRPAVYLTGGFTVMQGISLLWGIRRRPEKAFVRAHQGVVAFLTVYLLLTVPYCVMRLYVSWQMTRVSDFSTIPYFLPVFWQDAALWVWAKLLAHGSFPFFLIGFVLWNGKGERPETASDSKVDNPGG